MKTKFTINALVAVALPVTTDQDRLTQAIEASLNAYKANEGTWKRSGLKEVKKTADARFKESGEIEYIGERNIVSSFVQWHDRVVSLANRGEKFGCVVSVAEIPGIYSQWLQKFAKPTADKPAKTGKGKSGKESANGPARETVPTSS